MLVWDRSSRLANGAWKYYPQNQLWCQVRKSYFKTTTRRKSLVKKNFFSISGSSKNKHNVWPTKSIQLFSTEKFRFIKAGFEAPLNSASLWNLIWSFYPLRKFQGQRKIRTLLPKQVKAFRRKQFSLRSFLGPQRKGWVRSMLAAKSFHQELKGLLQKQSAPSILSRGRQGPWQLSAGGSRGNQPDFTFFSPTFSRRPGECLINQCKAWVVFQALRNIECLKAWQTVWGTLAWETCPAAARRTA